MFNESLTISCSPFCTPDASIILPWIASTDKIWIDSTFSHSGNYSLQLNIYNSPYSIHQEFTLSFLHSYSFSFFSMNPCSEGGPPLTGKIKLGENSTDFTVALDNWRLFSSNFIPDNTPFLISIESTSFGLCGPQIDSISLNDLGPIPILSTPNKTSTDPHYFYDSPSTSIALKIVTIVGIILSILIFLGMITYLLLKRWNRKTNSYDNIERSDPNPEPITQPALQKASSWIMVEEPNQEPAEISVKSIFRSITKMFSVKSKKSTTSSAVQTRESVTSPIMSNWNPNEPEPPISVEQNVELLVHPLNASQVEKEDEIGVETNMDFFKDIKRGGTRNSDAEVLKEFGI